MDQRRLYSLLSAVEFRTSGLELSLNSMGKSIFLLTDSPEAKSDVNKSRNKSSAVIGLISGVCFLSTFLCCHR